MERLEELLDKELAKPENCIDGDLVNALLDALHVPSPTQEMIEESWKAIIRRIKENEDVCEE